jgi:hypothetical protein
MREAEEIQQQGGIDPATGQIYPPMTSSNLSNGTLVKNEAQPVVNGDVVNENGDPNLTSDSSDSKTTTNHADQQDSEQNNDQNIKIMLSGFVKSELEDLELLVKDLGVEVTSQAKCATHLVMPKMGRTISFLCAISYVKHILKPEWIRESHKQMKLIGKTFLKVASIQLIYSL